MADIRKQEEQQALTEQANLQQTAAAVAAAVTAAVVPNVNNVNGQASTIQQ